MVDVFGSVAPRVAGAGLAASMLLACGTREASLGGPSSPSVGQDYGPIDGTVVDREKFEPLAGQTIVVGAERTTSDARGRFTFQRVPGVYDLTVVDARGTMVSMYKGLSRRDPIVVNRLNRYADLAHVAHVSGKLRGGGPYPLTMGYAMVSFVARHRGAAVNESYLAAPGGGSSAGPSYDSFSVVWDGPSSLEGELIALRLSRFSKEPTSGVGSKISNLSWSFGHRPIELKEGANLAADLELTSVPTVHVTARVEVPDGHALTHLGHWYRSSSNGSIIQIWNEEVNHSSLSFDSEIPDLTDFGASPCTSVSSYYGSFISAAKCNVPLHATTSFRLERAPKLLMPPNDVVPTPATRFSWTAFDRGIHVLMLEPGTPTETDPSIDVYTSATSSLWPDVSSAGVHFPEGPATYRCTIRGLGPHASMDDAVGPDGVGSGVFQERVRSDSADIRLRFPAPASTLPACDAPRWIACDPPPTDGYSLEKMNRTLRLYPRFAEASRLRCVRDCEGARAWSKAYDEYRKVHYRFDQNFIEDLEAPPPPAPPPPPGSEPAPAR
jgi:hypothetical protein